MTAHRHDDGLCRCNWCGTNPLYVAYHDTEWGVPEYDSRALFEKLLLDGFQAGLSWITILRKRDNFRNAFDGFDPEKMARYTPRKLDRLMQDAGIVRNRLKIEASVTNAQAYLAIPHFSAYLWNYMDGRPLQNRIRSMSEIPAKTPLAETISKDLQERGFRFVGPTIVYAFMQACGLVNDHLVDCHRHEAVKHGPRREPPRAWQRMLSGRRLDLLDPSPLDIEIEDIAHGLARVARWNGQTKGDHAFSVAQHCVLVTEIAQHLAPDLRREERLAALLHDAPEYVVGDMISPFKAALGLDYKAFEHRLLAAIHIRFGLPATSPPKLEAFIKSCDRLAAFLEATQLAGFDIAEATRFFGRPKGLEGENAARFFRLKPLAPNDASAHCLKLFKKLA